MKSLGQNVEASIISTGGLTSGMWVLRGPPGRKLRGFSVMIIIEVWGLAFRVSDFAVWSEAPWAHRAFRFKVPQVPKGFWHEVLKGSSCSSCLHHKPFTSPLPGREDYTEPQLRDWLRGSSSENPQTLNPWTP